MDDPEYANLVKELERREKAPFVVLSWLGFILFLGGILLVLEGGLNQFNAPLILVGGLLAYRWYQSDKYIKYLREELRKKGYTTY